MRKFEYKREYFNSLDRLTDDLDNFGLEGWELISIVTISQNNNGYAFFKRQIQ